MSIRKRGLRAAAWILAIVVAGCSTTPPPRGPEPPTTTQPLPPLGGSLSHPKTRWVPVNWTDLPGFADDALDEGWVALLANCQRPNSAFAPLCGDVRRLSIAGVQAQRDWLMQRLQPYRVESHGGQQEGVLTSYYEPIYDAMRRPDASHAVPLYGTPAGWVARRPWYSRQQIDTDPQAQAALRGREIAWMADPVDALMLHIQGSGRLRITEPDGRQHLARVAFAGTNELPYRSVQQWLVNQGATPMSRWPEDVKAWAAQNPQRVSQMLWSNPRYTFFREEALSDADAAFGPRGAQGVPLTAGRSVAVDRDAIPYGTPLWLSSSGPVASLQRLVVAQDTGSAIVGPVRADFFAGTGPEAGRFAARMKQPLRLWALWPRTAEGANSAR